MKIKLTIKILTVLLISSGCSSVRTVEPLVTLDAAALKRLEMQTYKNEFCTMGSKDTLGGMAKMPEAEQFAIGKCKPFKLDLEKLIILYFEDDESMKDYAEQELDVYLHPSDYASESDNPTLQDQTLAENESVSDGRVTNTESLNNENCEPDGTCDKPKTNLNPQHFLQNGSVVYFDVDSDIPLNVAELQRVAQLMKDKPSRVLVIGHADSTYIESHNMPLSQRRAKKVKDILSSFGVAENRISTDGRSSHEPASSNATAEGRALNRRVVIKEKPSAINAN
jgi:outer membrane protein OmpA-like peptidoglycan-associated protein